MSQRSTPDYPNTRPSRNDCGKPTDSQTRRMIEPFPLRFLLVVLARWVNRQQFEVVEYLKEENPILKAHLSTAFRNYDDVFSLTRPAAAPPGRVWSAARSSLVKSEPRCPCVKSTSGKTRTQASATAMAILLDPRPCTTPDLNIMNLRRSNRSAMVAPRGVSKYCREVYLARKPRPAKRKR